MRKFILQLLVAIAATSPASAQINAALFRFPAVSKTQIVFTYANDLWIVAKEGGRASRISSPPGVESFPRFSPDGNTIAFTADYDGNNSIYTIPSSGGIPTRITWQGSTERVVDWYPDGKSLLFASGRASGRERFDQFFKIAAGGGLPERLPIPYAEFGTLSPDGHSVALTFESQVFRNWKRYHGGWNGRIHLFNLADYSSQDITGNSDADDELPMWHGQCIYFLSDRGSDKRMNLWQYELDAKTFTQLTHFTDYDSHYPSLGPDDIVFENAGKLYLYNLAAKSYKEVSVQVVTDEMPLRPAMTSADKYRSHSTIGPDGKRILVEARGDIFSVPAENGPVKDLTQTPAIAERYPAWSPDGKTIAYWSDRSGEYELMLRDAGQAGTERQVTNYGPGFRYQLFWSPDSKLLAFIDQAMKIHIYDRTTGKTTDVDQGLRLMHGGCEAFTASWSPDSRWLTYDRDLANGHTGVFLFDFTNKMLHAATAGYYSGSSPVFDREGKYLFLLTSQSFNPIYSDLDNTFIYPNSTRLAAIVLKKSTRSPLYPKNDTVAMKKDEAAATPAAPATPPAAAKKENTPPHPVDIEFDGLESRLIFLPGDPGNYASLQSGAEGRLIYQQRPNTGAATKARPLMFYDLDKRKSKMILDDANGYQLAADGKHLLVNKDGSLYIIAADENQKLEKKLPTADMQMWVDPRAEWKQILVDAWRIERDYFYDPHMHGVDWNLVKQRYLAMLEGAATREELDFIIGEMIGELSSSHTYHGGGAGEETLRATVGYLGVDWEADGDHYRIKRIIRPAPWDAEARSPLDEPGVAVKEGDYILAVNGMELTTRTEPYALFKNLAGHSVELTYNSTPNLAGAHTVVVEAMADESRLRHLAWIEQNRRRVETATGGAVGYIYVRSTGTDGQNELIRQFTAQLDKKALIIDERFNSGGQIPDRFIEMLDRKPLAFWATRDGTPWQWPPSGNFGPKVMLINGWSGSGGDAFPDYFRKAGLGPLIGDRTWGGLIGISGAPGLIDGGNITVPTFRMYNPDGTWFKEGHGVDPDIPVAEDLTQGAKGVDNQLERGIQEIIALLKTKGFTPPKTPPYEKR
ncbi:MAG: PDZ domain-containing protein [Bacteroidota bacterium]|nr:PDZ domain-containing protein [Bacteroidota bacterium]